MSSPPTIFLTDNGSLNPDATHSLRRLAAELGRRCGVAVEPVSLLHSSGVDAAKLDGVRAEILEPAITRRAEAGARRFLVVPLFFGPTRAMSAYLPERVGMLAQKFPGLEVRHAPWLVRLAADGSERQGGETLTMAGDGVDVIADILADQVRAVVSERGLVSPSVALVDHGSPEPLVTRVRNRLAVELCRRLAGHVRCVRPCSMERREGDAYCFNEPLLAGLLRSDAAYAGDTVVSMLFLQPGRHAGPGGDVATICAEAAAAVPALRTHMTPLVGEHPGLLPLLEKRLRQGLDLFAGD